jgi:hypothetical protein
VTLSKKIDEPNLSGLGALHIQIMIFLGFQALRAKYLRNVKFFGFPIKIGSSWLWKGILKNRPVIEIGLLGYF